MSSYWIDLDGCQQVINDLEGILANDNKHFTGLDVDKDSVDTGTYGTDETDQIQDSAERTNAAYKQFYDEQLIPHYESIESDIRSLIDAMRDVVVYYASGDAAMAADAAGAENVYPEFRTGGEHGEPDNSRPTPDDPENGAWEYTPPSDAETPGSYNPQPFTTAHDAP